MPAPKGRRSTDYGRWRRRIRRFHDSRGIRVFHRRFGHRHISPAWCSGDPVCGFVRPSKTVTNSPHPRSSRARRIELHLSNRTASQRVRIALRVTVTLGKLPSRSLAAMSAAISTLAARIIKGSLIRRPRRGQNPAGQPHRTTPIAWGSGATGPPPADPMHIITFFAALIASPEEAAATRRPTQLQRTAIAVTPRVCDSGETERFRDYSAPIRP
jgi:hypothetical protein